MDDAWGMANLHDSHNSPKPGGISMFWVETAVRIVAERVK
jgi:hypothetical protein